MARNLSTRAQPLLKELTRRRQTALKGDESEITGRLIGFLAWMEGVRPLSRLLLRLREEGGNKLIMVAQVKNEERPLHSPLIPPDARTFEEIASVGLALIEEAKVQDKNIFLLARDFGLENGARSSESLIGRYVVPCLNYVEEHLPITEPEHEQSAAPAVIFDSLRRFQAQYPSPQETCFVMMRFSSTSVHNRVEMAVKDCLKKHGFIGVLARDREFHDDLFSNIQTYIHGCTFGIAIFERLETDEFNSNVALEVGYMFGLRKQVLLLKDKTLRFLQADLVGKLYREFDPQDPETTIPPMISSWLSDKGIA